MKKTIGQVLLIFTFLAFWMTGCGAKGTPIPTAIPPTPTPAATLTPGDTEHKLTVDGLERTYTLHIPPGLDSTKPLPVIFFFDGFGSSLPVTLTHGFNDTADKNGFLLVYPVGYNLSWNASICCGEALNKNIDDFAFVRQMITDLGTIASIDPKRVYATGFSNGAIFTYRLACEMSDTFAAIAPVEGWMPPNPCQPQQPVSVIHHHGLLDDYNGSTDKLTINDVLTDMVFPPVEQAITTWAQLDGCSGTAQVEKQGMITHTSYGSCKSGSAVELYALEGGGHSWPSEYVFQTNSTIWKFFAAHPKP